MYDASTRMQGNYLDFRLLPSTAERREVASAALTVERFTIGLSRWEHHGLRSLRRHYQTAPRDTQPQVYTQKHQSRTKLVVTVVLLIATSVLMITSRLNISLHVDKGHEQPLSLHILIVALEFDHLSPPQWITRLTATVTSIEVDRSSGVICSQDRRPTAMHHNDVADFSLTLSYNR